MRIKITLTFCMSWINNLKKQDQNSYHRLFFNRFLRRDLIVGLNFMYFTLHNEIYVDFIGNPL